MRKNLLIYILALLSLVSSLGFSYITDRSPITSCYPSAFISSAEGKKYYAYPEKLVIEPWHGRHHVYGIFMIPNGYKTDDLFTFTIPNEQTYCGHLLKARSTADVGIYPKSGYYLMQGFLNTRVALWLMFKGKVNQLKEPSSWKLGYVEKES